MSFSVFTALLWLFASASCAPTAGPGLQDACAEVRNSSLDLNRLAKAFSVQALNGPREEIDFYNSPAWMEAKDMCDPGTLKHNSTPCMGKILSVLTSYGAAVKRVAGIQICKDFQSEVTPAIQKLHEDLSTCLKSKGGKEPVKELHPSKEERVQLHEEALLCNDTKHRLFSFSILVARVFAVGDPAHHTTGFSQNCRAPSVLSVG